MIFLYTGNGGGKTTAALGLALRAIGHKKKVFIIQFMKGRKDIGEYKVSKMLRPYYNIYQFGRTGWIDLKNPSEEDKELARNGFEFAKKCLSKADVLILDEINLAVNVKLLDKKKVTDFLRKAPKAKIIVLTGRNAPKEFIKISDFVNEVKAIKYPKKIIAVKGIQF